MYTTNFYDFLWILKNSKNSRIFKNFKTGSHKFLICNLYDVITSVISVVTCFPYVTRITWCMKVHITQSSVVRTDNTRHHILAKPAPMSRHCLLRPSNMEKSYTCAVYKYIYKDIVSIWIKAHQSNSAGALNLLDGHGHSQKNNLSWVGQMRVWQVKAPKMKCWGRRGREWEGGVVSSPTRSRLTMVLLYIYVSENTSGNNLARK